MDKPAVNYSKSTGFAAVTTVLFDLNTLKPLPFQFGDTGGFGRARGGLTKGPTLLVTSPTWYPELLANWVSPAPLTEPTSAPRNTQTGCIRRNFNNQEIVGLLLNTNASSRCTQNKVR